MTAVRAEGVTVLFVEHDMEIVRRYAERVLAFYDGRIIADGAPEPCSRPRGAALRGRRESTRRHERGAPC